MNLLDVQVFFALKVLIILLLTLVKGIFLFWIRAGKTTFLSELLLICVLLRHRCDHIFEGSLFGHSTVSLLFFLLYLVRRVTEVLWRLIMSFVMFHSCGVVRIEPFSHAEWIHPLMCGTLERLKIDELVSMACFRSALCRYLNCTSSDPLFSTDTNLLAGHSVISTLIARLNTISRRPKLSSCRLKWPLSAHDVVFVVNDIRLTLVTNIISFCVKNG